MIRAALDRGCADIIIGVGGSATVDGGAGALQALGVRLLDDRGAELPPGGAALARLDRIDMSNAHPALAHVRLRVASDVRNVLCGREGAAAVFGPQKGATAEDISVLDAALARFAAIARAQCGVDLLALEGGGAAGGLAAGLHLLGASVEPGFALVADAVGLEAQIARADVVITGEGRLDAQTQYGKTAAGVAAMARSQGKWVIAIAGQITERRRTCDVRRRSSGDARGHAARRSRCGDAPALVRAATARALRQLRGGRGAGSG